MKTIQSKNQSGTKLPKRRLGRWILHRLINLVMMLAILLGSLQGALPFTKPPEVVSAHNLQTRMVNMFLDPATQTMLDARMAQPSWAPPNPLLEAGDEIGLVIKVIPRDGTTTGVGGHMDFYVPNGVQVVDVGYMVPDGSGSFFKTAMKGQSPIAIGAGPIGASATSQLIGMNTTYTNLNGVTELAVVPASGLHRGTLAGVYGDTGIFYATDPDTSFGSWQRFTGDSTANGCGSLAYNTSLVPGVDGETLVNNSGDTVIPCNKWDAEQLMAWGVKGGTYGQAAPIVDYADGRGNAPWGFASGVAGPQSGYAWQFNWDEWNASAKNPAAMQAAMSNDEIGPWKRIQYDGDRISFDQPGLVSTVLGYGNKDAGNIGATMPLPATDSQTDTISPKVIRWAVGQLTAFRPEYVWVKIKINSTHDIMDANQCPVFRGDTFGGDAGGTDGGKDHLWRYYEPTEVRWNGCLASQKPATREFVKVGDTYQYKINIYNLQGITLTNVYARDLLPSGVTFVSSVPAQNSGPNPLVYNIGTLLPGQKFTATVTVKAAGTGYLDNVLTITSNELPTQVVNETTISGAYPYLVPTKTVRTASVAPGGTVIYDVLVKNIGTGPTGVPVTIREMLPAGFTYDTSYAPVTYVNGALVTATVNAADLSNPVFTVPAAIQGGKQLTIAFRAKVGAAVQPGQFCNTYSVTQNGVPITTGSAACVTVAGGKIGDFIWRDWDGDGMQDAGEEGIAGVTVKLYDSNGTNLLATTTTDANGNYFFNGLTSGTYVVKVNDGLTLTGTTQTGDPDATLDNMHTVILGTDQAYLTADFGYKPTGTAVIGDKVFEDVGKDGLFTAGTDAGIANVTVWLYEDSNNNGIIEAGDALVATTSTNTTGDYTFSSLASGVNYLVKVDKNDPDLSTYFGTTPFQLSTLEVIASPNLNGSDLDNDFGFWKVQPGSIGDQVFLDANKNGTHDAGDSPLANVTVSLYRNGALVATTTTGADGKYLFPNLGPGTYSVAVDTADADLPGGLFATVLKFDVPLSAGQNYLTADFPFVPGMAKTVDKAYAVSGETLTFSIKPYYPGTSQLTNVRIIDPLPTGTTYVNANAGGTYGAYAPIAAIPGSDLEGGPLGTTTLSTAFTVSANQLTIGSPLTVTLNIKSSVGVNTVAPTVLAIAGGTAACTGPVPANANVPAGTVGTNFVWTCSSLNQIGEYEFSAGASDITGDYSWPNAVSASVLSTSGGGPNVVAWNLGSNTEAVSGQIITSGYTPGIYAFSGKKKKDFSMYSINSNSWAAKAQPANVIDKGGSLTTDGDLTIYGSQGNAKIFYSYKIDTNTWTQLAPVDTNFNEGGAVQYLSVGGANYVYALLGNSALFRRYNISTNNWTSLANTPANVKKGGALTTDGTYLYALQGDTKTGFWRYDISANTWTAMASVPANVGWGGSLTFIGGNIYALRGDGKTDFYRYNIASNTWTAMAPALGNVGDGGALTNDGTSIYALQGKTRVFWQYDISTNKWAVKAPINSADVVGQGGALVYYKGKDPQGRYTMMTAGANLVSTGDTIKVTFKLESNNAVTAVSAGTLVTTPTGGASASCGAAVVKTADNNIANINDPVIYEYTCTVSNTTTPGSLTFSTTNASGTSGGTVAFPAATSNSILVSPVLTFTTTVNSGAPAVIKNTAILAETSGNLGSIPSNTTETATSASIGDYVWADLNGDGLQTGETGIAGVKVYIDSNANGVWDSGEPFDITDASGGYRIFGLSAGTYPVRTDPTTYPAGYLPTTDQSLSVTLTAGQQYNTADFGLKPAGTGSIGDTVWIDANNYGTLDPTETLLPGIKVTLQKCISGECFTVAQTTTNSSGVYNFSGLVKGDYKVVVDSTSTVTSPYGGTYPLGTAMTPTYDKDGIATAHTASVTLPADTTVMTDVDFGYNWNSSIGDTVWWDVNANGMMDTGETPIANAVVLLYKDVNGDGLLDPFNDSQVGIAFTDANGNYLFSNLPPGKYLVDVYEDSITTDGTRDVVPTTGNVVPVMLDPAESVLTADFGYYVGALVQGNVFHDDDRNLYFEPGEDGLAGITVTLTGTDMQGNPITRTAVTDADGHFNFVVPEGNYTLTYNTSQTTTAGYPDPTTVTTYAFHAYPGEDWHPIYDFGVDYSGSLGDRIWNDANNNGVQDTGEVGIAGVTVNLYASDGTTWLGSTVTDAGGMYLFTGLSNSTFVVKVDTSTVPAGFVNTYDEDNGTATDGIAGSPNNATYAAIAGGETHLTADFGYYNAVTYPISGNVFNDLTNLGVKDGTDTGMAGITVYLYDSTGTTLLATAVTDSLGNYIFPGNPNGDYLVKVNIATVPPTYQQTFESDGLINNTIPVTVLNAAQINKDFGFHAYPSTISGSVCSQSNGNGLCETGETPVPGVTITLNFAGPDGILGTVDDTTTITTTDANGDYSFTNLAPGLYQVVETNLSNFTSEADADGGNPDNITVNLGYNQNVIDRDFEDYGGVDLQATKSDGLTTVSPGDTVVYTITVKNLGVLPANGVSLVDTLGTNLTYLSSTCGTPTIAAPEYTWSLGTLAAGETFSCTVTLKVANNAPDPSQVSNHVEVSTTSEEPNITNNEATDIDQVIKDKLPALSITKTDGKTQVLAGETLTYTIAYTNTGEAKATGVVVTDLLPANATYVSSTPNGVLSGSTLTWTIGTLQIGAYGTITVVVNVKPDLLRGAVVLNTAAITATETEFDLSDNTASDSDTVYAPYIVLEKSVTGYAYVGGVLTYTIRYDNNSAATSYNTIITDTIPANTTLVPGTITGGSTVTGGVITWNLGTLAPQASGTVSFQVTVNSGVTGIQQTDPTLHAETSSGTVTITSKTTQFASLPSCDSAYTSGCLLYRGIYQGSNSIGPAGWNENPRSGVVFDYTSGTVDPADDWTQPVAAAVETDYWIDPAVLGAEWTAIHTAGKVDPNYTFFRQAFCLPLNATDRIATLSLSGDDVSDIYLNGVYIGQQTGAGAFATFNANSGIQAGINLLAVRLLNNTHGGHGTSGEDHSGLLFNLQASYGSLRPFAYAPTMIMAGQTVTFGIDENALAGRRPMEYMIDFGDGTTAPYQSGTTFTHTYTTAGFHVATVTARAVYGCTATDTIGITVQPAGSVILGNTADVTYSNGSGTNYTGESGVGIKLNMGTLYGFVYSDLNGNGIYDAGVDTPAAGVDVLITDGYGGTRTVTTAADGTYYAYEVPSGLATVDLINPPAGVQTQGTDPTTVNVIAGATTFEENNGFFSIAALNGTVWVDEDSNGVQDAGESGVANVMVTATSNGTTYTTYTDSEGNYSFPKLPAGTYTVTVNTGTLDDRLEANPTYDLDGISTPHTTSITVSAGKEATADFGYNWAATGDTNNNTGYGSIGDRIWIDADGDGLQDPGEPGLSGIPVNLYADYDNDGIYNILVAATTTDSTGSYIFDDLLAASYVVVVNGGTVPSGYTQTGDPDQIGAACTTCDNKTSSPIFLAPGDVYLNADFGYMPQAGMAGSIGDTIWLDANGDMVQNMGEPGIAGVTVTLIKDLNGNGTWDAGEPIIASTSTDGIGNYSFTGLAVTDGSGTDDYLVWVNDTNLVLGELVPSYDNDGTATLNISHVSDLDAAGNTAQDFGYKVFGQVPGTGAIIIGDAIFLDTNNNGTADAGEGLEGVTVNLYDSTGTTLVASTVTNENGTYIFANLPAGTYTVKVDPNSLPTGVSNTVDPDGGNNNQATVTLSAGQLSLTQDFGYQGTNSVSGTIWKDTDADGLMDANEMAGIAGVTVVLYDSNGNIVATTVTDGLGNYSFTNLPNGTFTVDVTDNANVLNGYWHSLGLPNTDSNSQQDPMTVTLTGNTTITYADFGYYNFPAAAGNFVFYDANGNGIQDTNEPGIAGVIVTLTTTYPNGEVTTDTVVTDAAGYYAFGNLLLDEDFNGDGIAGVGGTEPLYVISIALPEHYTASPSNQGSNDSVDSDDSFSGQKAQPLMGSVDNTVDFGFYQLDLGDAPDSYITTTAVDGARNIIFPDANNDGIPESLSANKPAIWLGNLVDGESSTSPDVNANHDNLTRINDEDGVTVVNGAAWYPEPNGGKISVELNSSELADPTSGYLVVWFDWNHDGDFLDTGEMAVSMAVTWTGTATQEISFNIPDVEFALNEDLIFRARLFETMPSDLTTAYKSVSSNGETEDYFVPVTSLPVTLNYFYAYRKGASLMFEWSTGSETGNVGFNIYIEADSGFQKLNEELIPATGFTTQDTQDYTFEVKQSLNGSTASFYLEDMDIRGIKKLHGPFDLSVVNGKRVVSDETDWSAIAAENTQLEVERNAINSDKIQSDLKKRVDQTMLQMLSQLPTSSVTEKVAKPFGAPIRPTKTPTVQPTRTFTPTRTLVRTSTTVPGAPVKPTKTPRINPTATLLPSATATPQPTATLEPTATWTSEPLPTETGEPTAENTVGPTATEYVEPTAENTPAPTATEFIEPTLEITQESTATEFIEPTATDTVEPTFTSTPSATATPTFTPTPTLPPPAPALKIGDLLVSQTGIYRVTYEELLAAGLDLAGQPAVDVALTAMGEPLPITVYGPQVFGPGSSIEFYGQAVDTLYTKTNVYTLWVDRAKALRVEEDATAPDTTKQPAIFYMETSLVDQNKAYDSISPTGDPWYNTLMAVYRTSKSWTFPISVDHYLSGAANASLWLSVYGGVDFDGSPDHHVVVSMNGTQLANRIFDGLGTDIVQASLPAGSLREGANSVMIQLPADTGQPADLVYLDRYKVTYPRAYVAVNGKLAFQSAADLFQVYSLPDSAVVAYRIQQGNLVRMTDVQMIEQTGTFSAFIAGSQDTAEYYVMSESALLKPVIRAARPQAEIKNGSAQYLVIAHPNFIPGLTPFVQARSAQGLDVRVVDVRDIYDQFNYGIFGPEAIQAYIKHAYSNMGTEYVLLVGDDTYDYFNYEKTNAISFIPTIYMAAGDMVQFAPVDPKLVDINDDNIPDLPLGRLPVRTVAELTNVISKTLAYGTKTYNRTGVFAADWNYSDESDLLISKLPSGWVIDRAYLDFSGVTQARNVLLGRINEGIALTSYVGHSDDWEWTWDGLFSVDDAAALSNVGKPTIVTQNGCYNIYFVSSLYEGMADVMLNNGLNGAAAMIGSTTLSSDINEQKFGEYYLPLLSKPGTPVGKALLQSKIALAAVDPTALDILLGWSLLGDPYLKVTP